MQIKLSPRLMQAASYVPKGSVAADIGTDHAFLPIYLVQNNICSHVYASDIGEMPLQRAKHYIEKYMGKDCADITTVLSDGLKNIPVRCNVYIICGMGGDTVTQILSNAKPENGQRFIFQPQTSCEDLRIYLYENGYMINDETAVEDSGMLYTVIDTVYGEKKLYTADEAYFSEPMRKKKDAVTERYLEKQIKRIETVINGKKRASDVLSTDAEKKIYDALRRIRNENYGK